MTETREQRIERWSTAANKVLPSRGEWPLWQPTRRAIAEAIDASNTAAGLVLVSSSMIEAARNALNKWYEFGHGSALEDAMEALRKEIEG